MPGLFLPNLHGGFFIPVANVRPGNEILVQKALTYHDRCEYVAPVVFSDPIYTEPQEREYLWEFRLMPQDDQ